MFRKNVSPISSRFLSSWRWRRYVSPKRRVQPSEASYPRRDGILWASLSESSDHTLHVNVWSVDRLRAILKVASDWFFSQATVALSELSFRQETGYMNLDLCVCIMCSHSPWTFMFPYLTAYCWVLRTPVSGQTSIATFNRWHLLSFRVL